MQQAKYIYDEERINRQTHKNTGVSCLQYPRHELLDVEALEARGVVSLSSSLLASRAAEV